MRRACLSRLVFDVCKYLFVGNANTGEEAKRGCKERRRRRRWRRRRAQRRGGSNDDGGYTLNCSAEIDGVSSLPLERFVCPTYAARTTCICAPVCECMCVHAYVYSCMCNGAKEGVAMVTSSDSRKLQFLNVLQDCANFHVDRFIFNHSEKVRYLFQWYHF